MESKIQEKVTDENQEFNLVEYEPEFPMKSIVEDKRFKVVRTSQSGRDEDEDKYHHSVWISDQMKKIKYFDSQINKLKSLPRHLELHAKLINSHENKLAKVVTQDKLKTKLDNMESEVMLKVNQTLHTFRIELMK